MHEHLAICDRVGWRSFRGEVAAFDCSSQNIVVLNDVGSELWLLLDDGTTETELVRVLMSRYGLTIEEARLDVTRYLQQLRAVHMITGACGMQAVEHGEVFEVTGEVALLSLEMKAINHLIPFAVTFELTYQCNERCIHCYMDRKCESLTTRQVCKILDDLAECGTLFISFTGGEIFARRDSLEIVSHACKNRFVVDILSNGTLITDYICAILGRLSVRRVQVSIYGANARTHDAVTQRRGSFDQTIRGIKLLLRHRVKVEIAFTLMTCNFDERRRVALLAQELGCGFSPNPIITARNDGSLDTHRLRLGDEQLRTFLEDDELANQYAGRKPFADHALYFGFKNIHDAAPCYSGFNTCAISPQGKVLPCNQLLLEVGDLRAHCFTEIWNDSPILRSLRDIKVGELKPCADCSLLQSCSRCPGLALLEGGDLLGASPENCRVARIRHEIEKGGES